MLQVCMLTGELELVVHNLARWLDERVQQYPLRLIDDADTRSCAPGESVVAEDVHHFAVQGDSSWPRPAQPALCRLQGHRRRLASAQ